MSLSSDLISQFVKNTRDGTKDKNETTLFGTVVEKDGVRYVQLDGSEYLTPMITTVEARTGERVTVMIKNHSATVTGNISSPSAGTKTVEHITNNVANIDKEYAKIDFSNVDGDNMEKFYARSGLIEDVSITDSGITGKIVGVTVGGLMPTRSALYSGGKSSVTAASKGVYMGGDGQIAIGDSANFVKYYKADDGSYKLEISATGKIVSPAKLLWSGVMLMTEAQSVALPETVSSQVNGIVLVWKRYEDGAAQEDNIFEFFVHKSVVAASPSKGHNFFLSSVGFAAVANKCLHISDDTILGDATNASAGAGASGITYDNKYWALTNVYGV